jgi:hypothetical protein
VLTAGQAQIVPRSAGLANNVGARLASCLRQQHSNVHSLAAGQAGGRLSGQLGQAPAAGHLLTPNNVRLSPATKIVLGKQILGAIPLLQADTLGASSGRILKRRRLEQARNPAQATMGLLTV